MANLSDYRSYITSTRYDPSLTLAAKKAWKHQAAMLEFSLAMNHSLLNSGMSTGKTRYGLEYLEHFDGMRLVICPARAIPVWGIEWGDTYPNEKPFEMWVLDKSIGTSRDKEKILNDLKRRNAQAVVVLGYETAALLPLHKYAFTAAVADEAHRLGNYRGKQSRTLALTCSTIPDKVAMTGTPFHDGYERLYGIARWLDPVLPKNKRGYPTSNLFGTYDEFLDGFCTTYQMGYTRIIKGYKNKDRLARMLKPLMLSIKTEEVIDLPHALYRRYPVTLNKSTRAAYDALKDDAIIEFGDNAVIAPHVLTRILRLQQLISSGVLEDDSGEKRYFDISERLDVLEGILEELGDEPVVISCRFSRDVELIAQMIRDKFKSEPYFLTGSLDNHQEWRDGNGQYLIMSTAAGSEGTRLERASQMIRFSRSWSLKQHDQGQARIRRHGQKAGTVLYHDLVTVDSIDDDIYAALQRKSGDVESLDKEIA